MYNFTLRTVHQESPAAHFDVFQGFLRHGVVVFQPHCAILQHQLQPSSHHQSQFFPLMLEVALR